MQISKIRILIHVGHSGARPSTSKIMCEPTKQASELATFLKISRRTPVVVQLAHAPLEGHHFYILHPLTQFLPKFGTTSMALHTLQKLCSV